MKHEMKLNAEPFFAIQSGRKTVEMRLYDEKRSQIKAGDEIQFIHRDTGEVLVCLVTGLYRYESFAQLYKNHDKASIGYADGESAHPDDMLAYYSQEDIDRYGVVGIEIQRMV